MTLAYSYDRLGNEDGEPNGKAHRQEAIPAVNLNSTDNVSLVPLSGGATPEPIKLYNRGQPDLVDPRTGDAGGNAEPAQAELLDEDALVASAGLTTRINGSDGHGIMPKSKDRPLVTATTIIRPDQPRPHSYIASTGYISASNSSMPSPSISRHSSTASSANTAHSALYNNIQPANTIPNGAGNGSTSANGQASSHAYHRLSLGYPQRSPLSSAASSPDIASSPASQFSSEISTASSPNINRVVSGTSSNGTTIPSSPRSRRKPVPPLNLPILSARELPPMHPFASAQSSPRDPPVKMSTSQTRSGSGVSGGAGREGSSTPTFPPGSARSLGRGISVGGSGSNHSSEPGTPGFMEDKDLFFKPPKTSPMTATTPSIPVLGPVPPRRSPSARLGHGRVPSSSASSSPVAAPQAAINPAEQTTLAEVVKDEVERLQETEATSSDRRGTFHNGLNIHIPAPPAETTEQDVRRLSVGVVGNGTVEVAPPQEVEALRRQSGVGSGPATPRARYEGSPAFDTPSPTNTSPFPPNHEYLNRSLPSLPANASKTSLGMFSILQTGPQNGSNGSPTLAGAERNDRMASVDSTMTGLTSIATPKDMGRSTTTLDMFSALESGPDGRKYSATPLVGNQVYGAVGSTPQLKAYSPSLQTTDDKGISGPNNRSRKKSGRLGFFSHSSSRKSRGIPQTSAPGSIPEEDGEHDGGALSRQRTKKGETESDDEGFSVSRPPSKRKMFEAGQTYIRDERGNMIRFADLFPVVNGDSEGEVPTITKAELQAQVEGEIWKRRGSLSSLPSILHERDGSGTPTSATTPTQAPSAVPGMRSIPSNIATPPSSSRPSTMSNGRESGTYSRNVSGVSGASASPFAFNLTASNGSTSPYNTTHTITTQDIDLRTDRPQPKTVVFFIRTFYCGQCQDYTLASIAHIDPEALKRHNIRLVVISNGNWRHIKPYRELFKCPYPIYVDASRKLYRHMGMTKSTINPGPFFGEKRAAYNQNSVPRQWMQSMTTAVKLPKRNPGNLFQLGGEFILGPGYECIFAHRMTNFSNHMEASDVFRIAGIDDPLLADAQAVQLDEAQKVEADRLQKEMEDWRAKREATLETMARKKASRMGQPYVPPSQASRIMLGLDDPDDVDMAALQDSEDEDEVPHREAAARPRPAVTTGITENAAPNGNATIAPEGPDNYEGLDVAVANHSGQSDGPASEPMSAAPSADQPREEKPGQAGDREIGGKTAMELATIAHPIDKSTHPTDSTGSERGLGISAGDEHTGSASAISSAVSFPTAKAPADQEVERELSLAEKYEELMKKYEALKVEHDRRSSVAV